MKRVIFLALALLLCLGLCACSEPNYGEYEALIGYIESDDYTSAYLELHKFFGDRELHFEVVESTENMPTEEPPAPTEAEDLYVAVEITLDNWQEYFEIVYREEWLENAFGELTDLTYSYYFQLREEYVDRIYSGSLSQESTQDESGHTIKQMAQSKIDVEIGSTKTLYRVALDPENRTYTLKGKYSLNTVWGGYATEIYSLEFGGRFNYFDRITYANISLTWEDAYYNAYEDFEVLRIQGTIYLEKE